jgi:hypothetical protein
MTARDVGTTPPRDVGAAGLRDGGAAGLRDGGVAGLRDVGTASLPRRALFAARALLIAGGVAAGLFFVLDRLFPFPIESLERPRRS